MITKEDIARFVENHIDAAGDGLSVYQFYVFGSLLQSTAPRDVDMLIVYDDESIHVSLAVALRRELADQFRTRFNLELDVCLLSGAEAKTNPFIADEAAIRIL